MTDTISYSYDPVGNRWGRTSAQGVLPAQSPSYYANDWLATDGYDSDGNTVGSDNVGYTYDPLDRLISAGSGSSLVTIAYDGDGNRVFKTAGGVTTHYLVDSLPSVASAQGGQNPSGYAQVIYELRSDNASRSYVYGLDGISQTVVGTSTNYYGRDGQGSVRFLTGPTGEHHRHLHLRCLRHPRDQHRRRHPKPLPLHRSAVG